MSDTILATDKIAIGTLTGAASMGADRFLVQLTIRDGTDITQLDRTEMVVVLKALAGALGFVAIPLNTLNTPMSITCNHCGRTSSAVFISQGLPDPHGATI